jgi:hypothetical protein
VAALGPVPETAAAVGSYLARLATVSRALNFAHAAYATALDERSELAGRLEAYAVKAARTNAGGVSGGAGLSHPGEAAQDPDDDLGELSRRARAVLAARPADMARARALMAAHQAYLAALPTRSSLTTRGTT